VQLIQCLFEKRCGVHHSFVSAGATITAQQFKCMSSGMLCVCTAGVISQGLSRVIDASGQLHLFRVDSEEAARDWQRSARTSKPWFIIRFSLHNIAHKYNKGIIICLFCCGRLCNIRLHSLGRSQSFIVCVRPDATQPMCFSNSFALNYRPGRTENRMHTAHDVHAFCLPSFCRFFSFCRFSRACI